MFCRKLRIKYYHSNTTQHKIAPKLANNDYYHHSTAAVASVTADTATNIIFVQQTYILHTVTAT